MEQFVRRTFLKHAALLSAGATIAPFLLKATGKANPVILIVSGWQDVNIGDIAHTPGLVGLLKKRLPRAKIILWKKSESVTADNLILRFYPNVKVVNGQLDKEFAPTTQEVREAFQSADILIHGSGSGFVAADFVEAWHKQTKKPYGIFGASILQITPSNKILLQNASFIFTRETASIEILRKAGLEGAHIALGPDATFDLEIKNDKKANHFISSNNLVHRKFICVIPRLRITPYYKIRATNWTNDRIREVNELNDKYKEVDHAKLREAMVAWVRRTGNKIVVCPEMTYQVDIMDELLINPLPDDIKPFIVKHDYWLPDEAASLYSNAHAVLSFECHSPIIATVNGTPGIYLRQPEDTIKGQMYYDLGLKDYVFEMNNTSGEQITERLMEITNRYPQALKKVKLAMKQVHDCYDNCFSILKKVNY